MSAQVLNAVLSLELPILCYTVASDDILPADMKDYKGRTPADLARERKHNEVADFITNYKPLAKGKLHMIAGDTYLPRH